jgi:NADPH-dependent F420 reductase
MKIGIIGSGNVGGTLGKRWAQAGHNIVFASREPQSEPMRKLVSEAGPHASSGLTTDAARMSEIVLVATPWPATEGAIKSAGDLSQKIVIDATNPLLANLSGMAVGTAASGAEQVAVWAGGAKVVKAFNTVGYNIMADPTFAGGRVAMLYCGDDPDAKKTVAALVEELGFEGVDAGPLAQARVIEPFALLWISLALKSGYGREIGFRFLRRGSPIG